MKRPSTVLRVRDLNASVAFYHRGLGFDLDFTGDQVAQVTPPNGRPYLLALSGAGDVSAYMNQPFSEAPAGRRLYCFPPTRLDHYREALVGAGLEPGAVIRAEDESNTMEIPDPDGYVVQFWEAPRWTDQELITHFERAPDLLQAALAGLTEAQLDLARAPGKWSIRQTVHHLADSASSSLVRLLMALAEPGRSFKSNPYSQDRWVAALGHERRPIASSVALLTAIHQHVALLVRHVDQPLDRTLETDLGGTVTVRHMLTLLTGHVAGHTAQIRETRSVHGI